MFHLLLALSVFIAGAVSILLALIPYGIGAVLQLILTIFGQKRWVRGIPGILGGVGFLATLLYYWDLMPSELPILLIYWAIYFLCIWLVWLIVTLIKKAIRRCQEKG